VTYSYTAPCVVDLLAYGDESGYITYDGSVYEQHWPDTTPPHACARNGWTDYGGPAEVGYRGLISFDVSALNIVSISSAVLTLASIGYDGSASAYSTKIEAVNFPLDDGAWDQGIVRGSKTSTPVTPGPASMQVNWNPIIANLTLLLNSDATRIRFRLIDQSVPSDTHIQKPILKVAILSLTYIGVTDDPLMMAAFGPVMGGGL
jgi:hypothetical protein